LDRPAAIQCAVRRAGVLRDQGRQDRRDAQGRRVPDADAGVLERHGPHRWSAQLLARRREQRRQGTAGTEQRRVAWVCASPVPSGQCDQHREDRVMSSYDPGAPRSLFTTEGTETPAEFMSSVSSVSSVSSEANPPATLLSREDCEALAKKVLSFATADETRVTISSSASGNMRFA